MLTKVVELAIVPPYGIKVRFSNGQMGTHDCSKLVLEAGPAIELLRDPKFFARAFLEVRRPDLAQRISTCRPSGCAAKCWPPENFPQARREQNFRG